MIDKVKTWLKQCDILNDIDIRTDYLSPEIDCDYYSLEQEQTSNPLVKANVIGTKLKGVVNFTLAGRYTFDINKDATNNENLNTMQIIINWIMSQELAKNYPILDNNEEITGIEITSSPFLFGVDKSMTYSRYQFTFRINYERRI